MSARRTFLALLLVVLAAGCKPVGRLFDRAFAGELMQRGFRAVSIGGPRRFWPRAAAPAWRAA
ncbi:MAG: hypothetical protein KGL74_03720 [Elusimicrobia bacterium]|nr:hypothetical protein [Elusimicrobiota bacterium]MDE2510209.1 hypothetical protein [Elusimicrobiota bacterium]